MAASLMNELNPASAAPAAPPMRAVAESAQRDEWVAVSAATPEEQSALYRLLEQDGRAIHARDSWQDRWADWARGQSARAALDALREAGVPAAPVTRLGALLNDPLLLQRGALGQVQHAEVGMECNYGPTIRLAPGIRPDSRAAPLHGGDNEYVYGTLLGLEDDERQSLRTEGVI
jgi:crotonobetainyl-CoA:carnitine CoA-transferase CaiB-like acyl-CoA transferase